MSNLKNRLKKTAGANSQEVEAKLYKIIEDQLLVKMQQIGWENGTDGVMELIDGYMDSNFSISIDMVATAITSSIDDWALETEENFPNGAE